MRSLYLVTVLGALVALALTPAVYAADSGSAEVASWTPVIESTCSITVLCNCIDEEISCTGPTGTCFSGGTSCDEWVQCGTSARVYCPDPPPPGCSSGPTCTSDKQCNEHCYPDPGRCLGSCCAC